MCIMMCACVRVNLGEKKLWGGRGDIGTQAPGLDVEVALISCSIELARVVADLDSRGGHDEVTCAFYSVASLD